ncbi:MAG: YkgJ family cysteine cluster protein [Verrucomicrobia bacterium]|nr:YkgJ family cysteine cluster protein [Verrucomicrobiota bacterium]MCH8513945.1 YkgJ family cysteine cluster protein [Kiritimatiellia bacterium]
MESPTGEITPLAPPAERRANLRDHMRARHEAGNTCAACTGVCCTFVANSMRITPVEALDMKNRLISEGRWTPELFATLTKTVERYGLDRETGDGRRSLRKTYTCPFYTPGPRGCSIHPDHKPYGCLAFNARRPGITEGGDCASSIHELENREAAFPNEAAHNLALKTQHRLYWDKAPIPVALLALNAT